MHQDQKFCGRHAVTLVGGVAESGHAVFAFAVFAFLARISSYITVSKSGSWLGLNGAYFPSKADFVAFMNF